MQGRGRRVSGTVVLDRLDQLPPPQTSPLTGLHLGCYRRLIRGSNSQLVNVHGINRSTSSTKCSTGLEHIWDGDTGQIGQPPLSQTSSLGRILHLG